MKNDRAIRFLPYLSTLSVLGSALAFAGPVPAAGKASPPAASAPAPAKAFPPLVADYSIPEDSLQSLVSRHPDNPSYWFSLGAQAVRSKQGDLAKSYFDEVIKLAKGSDQVTRQVGLFLHGEGRFRESLPYLMTSLHLLETPKLEALVQELEKSRLPSLQLTAARQLARRTGAPAAVKSAAHLAFRLGEYAVCRDLLVGHADKIDAGTLRLLLLSGLLTNTPVPAASLPVLQKRHAQGETAYLLGVHAALAGQAKEARAFLSREAKSTGFRDLYHYGAGLAHLSADRHEEALESLREAIKTASEPLKLVIFSDLYRTCAITGNKHQVEEVWEEMKEQYQDPALQELVGHQLEARGYEKQAKYFYRSALRARTGSALALSRLFDDLLADEDWDTLDENLKVLFDRDAMSCEGHMLGMRLSQDRGQTQALLDHALNAARFCYEAREPYFVLGSTYLDMSSPLEARAYFARYMQSGGDPGKVPPSYR